jgi:hypothetical protein
MSTNYQVVDNEGEITLGKQFTGKAVEVIPQSDGSFIVRETMSNEERFENVTVDLLEFAKNNDISGMENYITSNIDAIKEIYNTYGSGKCYLKIPYSATHLNQVDFAVAYQTCLEQQVAGDVLFFD